MHATAKENFSRPPPRTTNTTLFLKYDPWFYYNNLSFEIHHRRVSSWLPATVTACKIRLFRGTVSYRITFLIFCACIIIVFLFIFFVSSLYIARHCNLERRRRLSIIFRGEKKIVSADSNTRLARRQWVILLPDGAVFLDDDYLWHCKQLLSVRLVNPLSHLWYGVTWSPDEVLCLPSVCCRGRDRSKQRPRSAVWFT